MNPSGYTINDLVQEAQHRWLKPAEVLFILQNHETHQITNSLPQKPPSGSLFLYNRRVLRFFRKDGHSWRRKRDGRTVGEAHERLKVGNVEAINCYYAHGEQNPSFQRRSFWMLDPENDHIVLVHYRDINVNENKQNTPSTTTLSPTQSSYSTQQVNISDYYEPNENIKSPGSGVNLSEEVNSVSEVEISQALRRIEEQLSLNDKDLQEIGLYSENDNSDEFGSVEWDQKVSSDLNNNNNNQVLTNEDDLWKGMLNDFPDDNNFIESGELLKENTQEPEGLYFPDFAQKDPQNFPEIIEGFDYSTFTPSTSTYNTNSEDYTKVFDQGLNENSLKDTSQNPKFTIQEISPDWGYASETTKVIIIGYFLCDPSEINLTCKFGDLEVPAQLIREGVITCWAPPHLPGKVKLSVTGTQVCEFEYRVKVKPNPPETQLRTREELLLLVRFVQTLLQDGPRSGPGPGPGVTVKDRANDELWGQVIENLLMGSLSEGIVMDWLIQEIVKDKLEQWICTRSKDDSFSKKEQGIIHMIAGLGFEWALSPILKAGVSVNFRDINGWTALHWAARFGREKMVGALIANGASAGAVTDPTSGDLTGRSPASIAATYNHHGLAAYLSEVSLTSHLTSLTLEESELSKGTANIEAEKTINSVLCNNNDTLAAVRNAAQAAARIQSAFRAHSFRKRQIKDDELDVFALSKWSSNHHNGTHNHNLAALSIQKKFRGYKGRREFLDFRKKVVKIQAHIRGYQVRRQYKVCWAVGILEKVVLRWRRRGVGLRGFRQDNINESEEEDILKVFRKQKVDLAIDEAVNRVLLMVECPDARQQYHRILEKYRQAKAELESEESEIVQAYMENDGGGGDYGFI